MTWSDPELTSPSFDVTRSTFDESVTLTDINYAAMISVLSTPIRFGWTGNTLVTMKISICLVHPHSLGIVHFLSLSYLYFIIPMSFSISVSLVFHLLTYLERRDIITFLHSVATRDPSFLSAQFTPDSTESTESDSDGDFYHLLADSILLCVGRPNYVGITPLHFAALKGKRYFPFPLP